MSVVTDLVRNISLPSMVKVRQSFARQVVEDIPAEVHRQLARPEIASVVRPGMNIAITAGSRGIANIHIILREMVSFCRQKGAHPFIIPAMGSHGGATVQGQLEVLHGYNITEETVGCPIKASMEVKQIGTLEDGSPLVIDKFAAEADGIIVTNRIKAHTAFRGRYESGLIKMMAIGLAKQTGAEQCHRDGAHSMGGNVERYGLGIHRHARILFGFGILENAYEETARLVALTSEEIPTLETELLREATDSMARIMFPEADVLVVDQIGKDISGDGMDPNITGRFVVDGMTAAFHAGRVVALDISEGSHGNGNGLGLADITTQRAVQKFDREKSYPNVLTSTAVKNCAIPLYMDTDKLAIQTAAKTCGGDPDQLRIIRIKNTLTLDEFYISVPLMEQARQHPAITVLSEPQNWPFNPRGNLL